MVNRWMDGCKGACFDIEISSLFCDISFRALSCTKFPEIASGAGDNYNTIYIMQDAPFAAID
jgi:hypothetical protein